MTRLAILLMCTGLAACGGGTTTSFQSSDPVTIVGFEPDDVIVPLVPTNLTAVETNITTDFGSLINGVRLTEGAGILTFDDRLGSAAQDYAQVMLDENHFGHIGPDGSLFTERVAATGYEARALRENIAAGHQNTEAVCTAWQNSEGHRLNNLAGDVDDFGIGFAQDGSDTRWVLVLGSEG